MLSLARRVWRKLLRRKPTYIPDEFAIDLLEASRFLYPRHITGELNQLIRQYHPDLAGVGEPLINEVKDVTPDPYAYSLSQVIGGRE